MTALMKIQSFIQAYVKAIASILDVDVTIVDNELVRVAGTGIYADEIGETVTHANFFHHILVSGESEYHTVTSSAFLSAVSAVLWTAWRI